MFDRDLGRRNHVALSKQIHIYSIDTGCFYNDNEKRIHHSIIRYGKHKNELKNIKITEFTEEKKKKYKDLCSFVNGKLKEKKDLLKKTLNKNKDIRILDEKSITDKKVISVFESSLTRMLKLEIDKLSTDIIVVETFFYEVTEQIVKTGFLFNGEKYRYFTASAGQIRTKKNVFIKESLWNEYEKTLMCGLTIDSINAKGGINVNKFLAYLALSNSATDLWEGFNIDKCIVVKDFETNVTGMVDYINDVTYQIERKEMDVPITHTDGCGMILPKLCRKNFMVRLPWIKGLLASFDFVKFIRENNCSPIVKDIYGKQWDVIKDDIQIIFTESQFKMNKFYRDWQEYKDCFIEHKCQAAICNMEENHFPKATINYQMMQTITDITSEEIEQIIFYSKQRLYNLSRDKNTMLDVFGVTKYNTNKTYIQQALEIYPELLTDEYCKSILRELKNSLIKKYKSGKLDIYGKYTFLVPDLYAFCEFLFLKIDNPQGLLGNGDVFCRLLYSSDKLDCLRSPHLFAEHAVRNNVIDEDKKKWFKTNAIYTSSHDLISRILQFDNDGDKSLVVADNNFISIVERNMQKYDAVPLYYEMKKANPVLLNSNSIYDGLNSAYKGSTIGIYSNNISKIWNSNVFINGDDEQISEALNIIKILCMENNYVIDYAKTLYKPKRPDDINKKINSFIKSKLPHFFIYAKDKSVSQVERTNDSLVNRFDKEFKNTPLRFSAKNFGKLDYKYLMDNPSIQIDNDVINIYNKLNKTYHFKIDQKNQDNVDYIIKTVRDELLCQPKYTETEIADMLIKYLYSNRKTAHKEILWKCFGNIIIDNLNINIPADSIQCEYCGGRFISNNNKQKYCCFCAKKVKNNQNRKYREENRKSM